MKLRTCFIATGRDGFYIRVLTGYVLHRDSNYGQPFEYSKIEKAHKYHQMWEN